MSKEFETIDVEIVYNMLLESGIDCDLDAHTVFVRIPKSCTITRKWIFGAFKNMAICERPNVEDPDFIEKVKEFVKFCNEQDDCTECVRFSKSPALIIEPPIV